MKKALGRSSLSGPSGSQIESEPHLDHNTDPTVYKPGEQMPRAKYRAPVHPKHKEKLDAFSFNWKLRRTSDAGSAYSPGGTRLPSRNNSVEDQRARKNSFADGTESPGGKKRFWRRGSKVDRVVEDQGDDADITNGRPRQSVGNYSLN